MRVNFCRIDIPLAMATPEWLEKTERQLRKRGLTKIVGRIKGSAYSLIAMA